jgi:hypothetical protein
VELLPSFEQNEALENIEPLVNTKRQITRKLKIRNEGKTVISSFRRGVNEICALLGFYAA